MLFKFVRKVKLFYLTSLCLCMLMIFSLKKTCVCVPACLCSAVCLLFKGEACSFKGNDEKATLLAMQIKGIYSEMFF